MCNISDLKCARDAILIEDSNCTTIASYLLLDTSRLSYMKTRNDIFGKSYFYYLDIVMSECNILITMQYVLILQTALLCYAHLVSFRDRGCLQKINNSNFHGFSLAG